MWNLRQEPGERLDDPAGLDAEGDEDLVPVAIDELSGRAGDARAIEPVVLQPGLAEPPECRGVRAGEGVGVVDRALVEVGLGEDDGDGDLDLARAAAGGASRGS